MGEEKADGTSVWREPGWNGIEDDEAGIEKEITPKDLKGCMGEYARELMREWCG